MLTTARGLKKNPRRVRAGRVPQEEKLPVTALTCARHARLGALVLVLAGGAAHAEEPVSAGMSVPGAPGPASDAPLLLAAQYTFIDQWQSSLDSPYPGLHSLNPGGDRQATHTIGFYGGWAPRSWAQLYLDGEKFMGAGVSAATGLGAPTNGDVIRQGEPGLKKEFYIARLYARLMLPLSGEVAAVTRAQD